MSVRLDGEFTVYLAIFTLGTNHTNKKENFMAEENLTREQYTYVILGDVKSEKQDFFSKLNSFTLFMIIDKNGRTLLNIPAWPVLVALVAFFVIRAKRS